MVWAHVVHLHFHLCGRHCLGGSITVGNRLGKWFVLLALGVAAIVAAYYAYFMYAQKATLQQNQLNTLSREGIVTQIHELNRLETMAFQIDTVVRSEKEGTWYKLWQDHEKGLFVVKGQVVAGVDLSKLSTNDVTVSPDGKRVVIDLPAAELFSISLSDIQMYDYQRGWLNPEPVNPEVLSQVQTVAKTQVKQSACKADILRLANDNASKQVTRLFELTGTKVSAQAAVTPTCS